MVDTERYQQDLDALRDTITKAGDALNLVGMQEELTELKEEMNAPNFGTIWSAQQRLRVMRAISKAKSNIVRRLFARCDDVEAMLSLLKEERMRKSPKNRNRIQALRADSDALELKPHAGGI